MASFIPANRLSGEISNTQVAFGDSNGDIAGSDNFTFTDETAGSGPIVTVKGDQPYLHLEDDTDATNYKTTFKQSGNSLYLFTDAEPGSATELARLTPAYMHWNRGEQDVNFLIGSQQTGSTLSLDGATGDFKVSRGPGDHVINTDTSARLTTLRTGVNVINDYTGGNAFLEIRGDGLAFLDLGEPTSTDYTLRLITTSATTGSIRCLGDLRIQTDGNNGDITFDPNGSGRVKMPDGQVDLGPSTAVGAASGTSIMQRGNTTIQEFIASNQSSGDQVSGIRVAADGYRSAGMLIGDVTDPTSSDAYTEQYLFGRQYAKTGSAGISAAPEAGGAEYVTVYGLGQAGSSAVIINDDQIDMNFRVETTKNQFALDIDGGTGDITMNGEYGELFRMDSSASAVELYKLALKDSVSGTKSYLYDTGYWLKVEGQSAIEMKAAGDPLAWVINAGGTSAVGGGFTRKLRKIDANLASSDYTSETNVNTSGSLYRVTNANATYNNFTIGATTVGYSLKVFNDSSTQTVTINAPPLSTINGSASITLATKKMFEIVCVDPGEWVTV
jgi:hypothetical protein